LKSQHETNSPHGRQNEKGEWQSRRLPYVAVNSARYIKLLLQRRRHTIAHHFHPKKKDENVKSDVLKRERERACSEMMA
jgi:hypothetical protein